jgi:hypothetical protein
MLVLQVPSRFPTAAALLACAQLHALVPLSSAIWRTHQLPSNIDAQYRVYQDLEGAKARVFMPAKLCVFGTFASDAHNASAAVGGPVPVCGFGDAAQGGERSQQQPLWMLPDDDSGLRQLVATFVRFVHCACLHAIVRNPTYMCLSSICVLVLTYGWKRFVKHAGAGHHGNIVRAVQDAINAVARSQRQYIRYQVVIVPLVLLNWVLHAARTKAFAFMMRPLALAAVPLAELGLVLALVATPLGVGIHLLVGDRVAVWSGPGSTAARMGENVFVGGHLRAAQLHQPNPPFP